MGVANKIYLQDENKSNKESCINELSKINYSQTFINSNFNKDVVKYQ